MNKSSIHHMPRPPVGRAARASAKLKDIQLFVAVFEERSFSRAAEREHATQSGVSQHIKSLEQQLGVMLLRRERNQITPTPAGESYYRRCIEVLRAHDEAATTMRRFVGSLDGEVRLGLMPTLARRVLTPALSALVTKHPNLTVQVVEGYSTHLVELIRADRLDFAIVPVGVDHVGLRTRHLLEVPEVLLSSRTSGRFPDRAAVRLKEAGPIKLVVPGGTNARRHAIESYCASQGVVIDRLLEIDGMVSTLDFVSRTDWVTILPALVIGSQARDEYLVANPILPDLRLQITSVESSTRVLADGAEALRSLLHEIAQREAASWLGVPSGLEDVVCLEASAGR